MKKSLVLLLAIAAILFIAACGSSAENGNGNGNEIVSGNDAGESVSTPGPVEENIAGADEEHSPATVVSAFFGYLASGNVRAADSIFTYSNGGFAFMAEDMYNELGTFIFNNISYHGLDYTVNGNNATASFTMVNTDFAQTAYEAGFAIGEAGLVDFDDPNFEEALEELLMPMVAEMILDGTAPTFEIDVTISLRLVGDAWRIVDNDVGFAMALLGII